MTNIDIIDNLSTGELFLLITGVICILIFIIFLIYLIIDWDREIKVQELNPYQNYHLVISVEPLPNGSSKFYCDDGHIYYGPIWSYIMEGDLICKDDFIMIK